ncbi:MAG: iron-containing alcohol dehydrogenase [Elusimicrobiales bacterium]|nr:iron-containing alcohol dehydrogenase [Elusimicrobiales bacterium]
MDNFVYQNPTKIVFGKDVIKKTGKSAKNYGKKALLVYGKESIKKNGVYDTIVKSLKDNNIDFVEHGGVKPNPVLSFVKAGIEKFRRENCDMIIAAGGGSVIDTSKAISSGVKYNGDVWDFFIGKARIEYAVPIIVVLTIPATGSESNSGCVITNEETKQKYSAGSFLLFPKVSFLDPTVTFTLPKEQSAYGAVDAMLHISEGYFTTKDSDSIITDNYDYALIKSIILATNRIMKDPRDYNARASFMWTASLALNGGQSLGYKGMEFVNHVIEHSLSAIYDIPHGLGLGILFPGFLKHLIKKDGDKAIKRIVDFGRNIFEMELDESRDDALKVISKIEGWFNEIGVKTRLSENGIPEKDFDMIADNANQLGSLWGWSYTKKDVIEILNFQK